VRQHLSIPVITSNRINMPDTAEQVIADGHADMVSMARPFLADAQFVNKAAANQADHINTCIGCNQACLDHVFQAKTSTCLVNPRACNETKMVFTPVASSKNIAVIGAGPAGLACAVTAAQRGHKVSLYDDHPSIGGQFNIARRIPGKEEFNETLRYYQVQLEELGVAMHLNTRLSMDDVQALKADEVVIATGITPRQLDIPGINHTKVLTYLDVMNGAAVGNKVAIIGAGGIGFDIAEYLSHGDRQPSQDIPQFMAQWGIDMDLQARGGIANMPQDIEPSPREIHLLQRKANKVGSGLGKTTGWIHRLGLQQKQVHMHAACEYLGIDDAGLHVRVAGETQLLDVDHVVICAGQEPLRELAAAKPGHCHIIGGADKASELDAKRAIRQGTKLAMQL
jgi:2,4-dienoyl-CoA reductase (NADPH2)